jgi:hypothetical protein
MMALALFNVEIRLHRAQWRQTLLLWLVLLAACLAVYNGSIHFDRGGFIFSILDKLDARHVPWCVSSPLLLSLILTACAAPLQRDPMTGLALLGFSATLAISNVFYIKYIDFYVWPLALSIFTFAPPDQDGRLATLTKSLAVWSAVNLVLVSLRY